MRNRGLVVGLVVAAVVAGAVAFLLLRDGEQDEAAAPTPTSSAPPAPGPRWPLTGLPAAGDTGGPVLAVKIDNTASAFPQQGLELADVVVEEPVEGGVTRLAALLHSAVPESGEPVAGPVRSVRSSDIGVVKPARAVVLASGGARAPVDDLEAAGVETRFEGTAGFSRDPSRPAPYDLVVDVVAARSALPPSDAPPPYFTFAEQDLTLPDAAPAAGVVLRFSPEQSTELRFDGSTWARVLDPPDGFTATTVVALLVEQDDAGYLDPGGNPVPLIVTEGSGPGWLAHAGRVVDIEWTKATPDSPWTFTTVEGEPLAVPTGRTYVGLLPVTTGSLDVLAPAEDATTG